MHTDTGGVHMVMYISPAMGTPFQDKAAIPLIAEYPCDHCPGQARTND